MESTFRTVGTNDTYFSSQLIAGDPYLFATCGADHGTHEIVAVEVNISITEHQAVHFLFL